MNVHEIRVAGTGSALDVEWLDNNSWRVEIPVVPGAHAYTLQAIDFSGVAASLVAGEYGSGDTNKLANGGEQIVLVDALGTSDSDPTAAGGDLSLATNPGARQYFLRLAVTARQ
ncbi:MAG: hypothetical protein ACI8XO_001737 [Verrucomicrobiales bacterium]